MCKWILLILFIICLSSLAAYKQSDLERMAAETEWIVGKGVAKDELQADRYAIADLLSQISVQVESSFENIVREENNNLKEYCTSLLKTYSNTRLDGAERRSFEQKDTFTVYRFIRKENKNQIFMDRQNMLISYLEMGLKAERELRIGDALQNYYWSLILLRTHPDINTISHIVEDKNQLLITFIPQRMRSIFAKIQFSLQKSRYDAEDKASLVELSATYAGEKIQNMDIVYYFGNDWSSPVSILDGAALLEFYCQISQLPNPVGINIVYSSRQKSAFNTEIVKIMDEMSLPLFSENRFRISSKMIRMSESFEPKIQLNSTEISPVKVDKQSSSPSLPHFESKVVEISEAINKKDFSKLEALATLEGKKYIEKILKYGRSRLVTEDMNLIYDQIGDKIVVRGMPLQFSFDRSGRTFTEQMALTFNSEGKLEKANFSVSDRAVRDILGSIKIEENDKQQIVNFIEDYKTAYCLRDIEFVQKVFSDNALIIVGSTLREDPQSNLDMMYKKLGKRWKATQYSKQEYVANLQKLFASNEFINLKFEDNLVTKTNNPDSKVFGIQIHQYYYSEHYADEGYLFLMFDLEDSSNPKIQVRTWQPEKNPDGSIFGLNDFFMTH